MSENGLARKCPRRTLSPSPKFLDIANKLQDKRYRLQDYKDGRVVMKIIKHCSQKFPSIATGSLVGLDVNGTLEITNTFPFPVPEAFPEFEGSPQNAAAIAPRTKANQSYQNEMIRMLREVNVDANNVGWYTSANMGNFINQHFIETQCMYQREINERTVALVHDVSRSSQGSLSLRAYRLSPQFMSAFMSKEPKFTTETLQASGLQYQDILVELPVHIHNSHLVTSFLHQLPTPPTTSLPPTPSSTASILTNPSISSSPLTPNFDHLALSIDPFLTQTCDALLDTIDVYHTESNNFSYYTRALAREQAKISAWQTKRKAENTARALSKQPLLPEDEWQKLFKLPPEPSRLESLLNGRQAEQYSRQVDGFVAGTSAKMFAVRGNLLPRDGEANEE
ncbi:MAG: hypothetical protein Q9227_007216 [Pyrenula ochraceoflavens]